MVIKIDLQEIKKPIPKFIPRKLTLILDTKEDWQGFIDLLTVDKHSRTRAYRIAKEILDDFAAQDY